MDGALRNSLARPVPWLESFSIDSGLIDDDHRRLIDMCNELCCNAAQDAERAVALLEKWDVPNLVNAHFTNEDWLLAEIAFPGAAAHRREHDSLRSQIDILKSAQGEHRFAAGLNTARTLLVEHLVRHDLGFKSHLQHREGR